MCVFYALIKIRFDAKDQLDNMAAEEYLKNSIRVVNAKIVEKKIVGWETRWKKMV